MISAALDTAWTAFSKDYLQAFDVSVSSKLELKYDPLYGRSIVAGEDINPNEVLIRIPPRGLLNIKTMDLVESDSGAQGRLAVMLSQAKLYSQHEWHSFTGVLPGNFDSIPLTWYFDSSAKDKYKVVLSQPAIAQYVETQRQKFLDDHEKLAPSVPVKNYLWAWLCVNTRCLYTTLTSNKDDNLTLAPVIDFLNHTSDTSKACRMVYTNHRGMSITSTCHYPKGSEVYLNYGAHSNLFLLCEYGFVLFSNPDDFIDITGDMPLNDLQLAVLKELGYTGPFTVSRSDGASFLTAVALVAATLEHNDWTTIPRKLKLLCGGFIDETQFSEATDKLLSDILRRKVVEWTELKRTVNGHSELEILIEGWLQIANSCISRIV